MLYAFPIYYLIYSANYAHGKLNEICYQNVPKNQFFYWAGPNLGRHGPLGQWIFSTLHWQPLTSVNLALATPYLCTLALATPYICKPCIGNALPL